MPAVLFSSSLALPSFGAGLDWKECNSASARIPYTLRRSTHSSAKVGRLRTLESSEILCLWLGSTGFKEREREEKKKDIRSQNESGTIAVVGRTGQILLHGLLLVCWEGRVSEFFTKP